MTTTSAGGKTTGDFALTMATDVALAVGDFVHVSGPYKVALADGSKPIIGHVSVRSVKRTTSPTSMQYPVATTTGGQVTVEARAHYVKTHRTTNAIAAGAEVGIDGTGALATLGTVAAKAATRTVGTGNGGLLLTARDAGGSGNGINFSVVVAGANTALSVVVNGNDIIVNSATSAGSAATSTVAQIIAALAASAAANALVVGTNATGSDGTGVVGAVAAANLSGGAEATVAGGRVGIALTTTTGSTAQDIDILVD